MREPRRRQLRLHLRHGSIGLILLLLIGIQPRLQPTNLLLQPLHSQPGLLLLMLQTLQLITERAGTVLSLVRFLPEGFVVGLGVL